MIFLNHLQAKAIKQNKQYNMVVKVPSLKVSEEGSKSLYNKGMNLPEYDLIPWLSRALGKAGYTDDKYPAAFFIHNIARAVAITPPSFPR